jgi:hypothetical protein
VGARIARARRGPDGQAAVECWATCIENGERLTLAGTTVLRFDQHGRVVDHRDYWSHVDRREPPFEGW